MKPSCSRSFSVHDDNGHLVPEGLSTKLYDLDEKHVRAGGRKTKTKKKSGLPRLQGHGDDKQKHFEFCFQAPFQAQKKKRVVSG